jgi:hypothetical protein
MRVFCPIWICLQKAARKMLMKLTPAVNFIYILRTTFLSIFWHQNIAQLNVFREKLLNLVSYEKRARKMLMKLTPGVTKASIQTHSKEQY